MNGYTLTKSWYNHKFNNRGKVRAIHSDMYFYILDLWNRLGNKKEFGLPTSATMEMLEIGSYNTYKKTLSDLVSFGFIKVVSESKNQHVSKIVAISKIDKATDEALDKALDRATDEATDKALDSIDKLRNLEIKKLRNERFCFFWDLYGNKKSKPKAEKAWSKLTDAEIEKIFLTLPDFLKSISDKKFLPHPTSYLNAKRWEDELTIVPKKESIPSELNKLGW